MTAQLGIAPAGPPGPPPAVSNVPIPVAIRSQRRREVGVANRRHEAVRAEREASCVMRTAGSAKLLSVAVHECVICGQGHDWAPQDVSATLGAIQCTWYGVTGPVIAATRISLAGALLSALIRAATSATGVSRPSHSDDVQFCRVAVSPACPFGAMRGGRTPSQTWPYSLQR